MNENDIFRQAIEFDDWGERLRFVAESCGDDQEKHERVISLLNVYAEKHGFLNATASIQFREHPDSLEPLDNDETLLFEEKTVGEENDTHVESPQGNRTRIW